MELKVVKLEATLTLSLTEREVEMFKAMSEYDGVDEYCSKLTDRFKKTEWAELLSNLHSITQRAMQDVHLNSVDRLFPESYDRKHPNVTVKRS